MQNSSFVVTRQLKSQSWVPINWKQNQCVVKCRHNQTSKLTPLFPCTRFSGMWGNNPKEYTHNQLMQHIHQNQLVYKAIRIHWTHPSSPAESPMIRTCEVTTKQQIYQKTRDESSHLYSWLLRSHRNSIHAPGLGELQEWAGPMNKRASEEM